MEQLKGQTLEAVMITTRTSNAAKALARRGVVREEDFPLLMCIDGLLNEGKALGIPWHSFQRRM